MPTFSARSRRAIIEAGRLDWKDINPDIFGSMIQAVVDKEKRGGLGMHYTSVPNIMKVIEPLFLNDLRETFSKARGSRYKKHELATLRDRLGKLKIFDPACGSGNFLIIAYKELRQLEMDVIQEQQAGGDAGAMLFEQGAGAASRITLDQFYGIEIDDFAHEIAILALWLAEHQMNVRFRAQFGVSKPTLPLTEAGHIVHANACRVDWEEVCPKEAGDETYILGNPPYLGFKMQDSDQKSDIKHVFKGKKGFKKLDLISCWFYLSSKYVSQSNSRFALVTTNSICQGEHASLLWPHIFESGNEIKFAYTSFPWQNNAKLKAAVICSIVGVSYKLNGQKIIYSGKHRKVVSHINAYLSASEVDIIPKRSSALSDFPRMYLGNMPKDNGNLTLDISEVQSLTSRCPESEAFIRELIGAYELMNGTIRYCLWIYDDDLALAESIPSIKHRIGNVRDFRLKSKDKSANKMAATSHKFREQHTSINGTIIVPTVTSSRRDYIPMDYLSPLSVVVAPNNAIYDPPRHLLGIIASRLHMTWMRTFAGRLKSDYRYSSTLVYNTFPFPKITPAQEAELTATGTNILLAREHHPGKTLADLYDPDKMPANLREAHRLNDEAVEACYRPEPFESDEERLEHLFKLYERMIAKEGERKLAKKA